MKRIVIACDGTWNRLDARHPTNVAKLAQAVLPVGGDGVPQITSHLDGVGAGRGTGWLARMTDRALGGALGLGLMANLEAAYRFLVLSYAPGDEIYLFGFSRGAYTARSLAGLIVNCGILERSHAEAIPRAIAFYRARDAKTRPSSEAARIFRAVHATHVTTDRGEAAWRAERSLPPGTPLRITYLGVWDTVGALGLPGHLWLAAWLNRGLAFHDTRLSRSVLAARHAVAVDERRRTFPPTLWDNLDELNVEAGGRPYQQRWFPGDHSAVGGGRGITGLSEEALVWIVEGAMAAGLDFDPRAIAAWCAGRDWRGPLQGPVPPLVRVLLLDAADREGPGRVEDVAEPAARRWHADPEYRPRALARVAPALEATFEAGAAGGRPAGAAEAGG